VRAAALDRGVLNGSATGRDKVPVKRHSDLTPAYGQALELLDHPDAHINQTDQTAGTARRRVGYRGLVNRPEQAEAGGHNAVSPHILY